MSPTLRGRIRTGFAVLGVAERSPQGWRLVHWSSSEFDGVRLGPSSSRVSIGMAEFRLRGLSAADLVDRWPVVLHQVVLQDPETEEQTRFEVVVHGSRTGFGALLHPKPWWP